MNRRNLGVAVLALCAGVVLTGCMPKMTIEEMKAMMPQRPAELDRLDAFAGSWTFEGEVTIAGLDEVLQTSGTSEGQWQGDRGYLVAENKFSMGELGDMEGLETWTYDTKANVYRSTWTDNMGSVGTGTSRYDEQAGTWHMKGSSYGPFGKTTYKGHVKILDDDTMEWTWTEYTMCGLMKTMEMTGTSKRE